MLVSVLIDISVMRSILWNCIQILYLTVKLEFFFSHEMIVTNKVSAQIG